MVRGYETLIERLYVEKSRAKRLGSNAPPQGRATPTAIDNGQLTTDN